MSRTPTAQQQAAVDAVLNPVVRELKLVACAGAGKTSTLEMMAKAMQVRSLYLCFNKANAEEAKGRFPEYVDCRSGHSAAFTWGSGRRLSHKLTRPKGAYVNVAYTGSEIARFFHIQDIVIDEALRISGPLLGLLTRLTVTRFEQSADSELSEKHVPLHDLKEKLGHMPHKLDMVKRQVVKHAKKLWKERIDESSPVQATHDTYLKLYQLSKPVFKGFEVLYVDEYQDTTPCMHNIVRNQVPHMKVVIVGDARQAIYGWRGAVNAMDMTECETRMLTKSFRYGQAVADVATCVLEGAMVIEGFEKIESKVGMMNVVDKTQPYTCLYRTNSALLVDAVAAISNGAQIAIEIDTNDFVKFLESATALCRRSMKDVKHDKILPYQTWEELLEEAKQDPELSRVSKAVADGRAERWINVLRTFKNADSPHITFTTAHKSKGREWKQVIVMDDFKSGYNEDGEWTGLSTEEQNLLYVACTRAQERLQYNAVAQEYINRWQADSGLTQLEDEEQGLEVERMDVDRRVLKAMMGDITEQIKQEHNNMVRDILEAA